MYMYMYMHTTQIQNIFWHAGLNVELRYAIQVRSVDWSRC